MSETLRIDQMSASEWDALVVRFDDAVYDQTAFLAESQWGPDRLSHLALLRDGTPVGAAQVVIFRPPVLKALPGIAYVKFGPLWQPKSETPRPETLHAVLDALIREYVTVRGLCLTVVPQPDPDHAGMVWHELERRGFRQRRGLDAPRRYIVDLSLDAATQRLSLGQKWRYNLKKAETSGVEVRVAAGRAGAEAFMALNMATRERKSYDEETWVDRFPELLPDLPAPLKPEVVLAYHDGTPTAGAVVGRLGKTAVYLFGGTDARALRLRAGYALQWWITGWLTREGMRWYDLDSDADSPGLRQFKSGLAGKAGHVFELPGEFDIWDGPASRIAADTIQSIRSTRNAVRGVMQRMRSLSGAGAAR